MEEIKKNIANEFEDSTGLPVEIDIIDKEQGYELQYTFQRKDLLKKPEKGFLVPPTQRTKKNLKF